MDIEGMFEDLEGRMRHAEDEEWRAVTEELTRAERAQITIADRLRASAGAPLALRLRAGHRAAGTVEEVGGQWVRLARGRGSLRIWVPLAGIEMIEGLPRRARPAPASRLSPASLQHELRALSRDRALVRIETASAQAIGTIAGVGEDMLDLRSVPTGEASGAREGAVMAIALEAIVMVAAEAGG